MSWFPYDSIHSRQVAHTIGRWRLSVHNTASTSDIEQYNTHCTRYPTEVLAALRTVMSPEPASLR
jgi:hypothetical protein